MASYRLEIRKSAQKEIRSLSNNQLRNRIVSVIEDLRQIPIPEDAKKIKGSKNIYRITQGAYRIVYAINKNELVILVIRVRHRKDVYKNL
jgi:mRNA interferase RelE/StbE